MSYSITCSTKILTLAIALFWFILVGNICEFYGARCVVPFIVCLFLLRAQIYTFSKQIKRDLNLCLTSCYYAKVVVKLKKTQTKNLLWCL